MPYGSVTAQTFALASILGSSKRTGAPVTCYFALTNGGVEPTIGVGGYARIGITNDDALWTITTDTAVNDVEIRWSVLTAPWSETTVDEWAIYDAATAGVCWVTGTLTTPMEPSVAGRQPVIPAGFLDVVQEA